MNFKRAFPGQCSGPASLPDLPDCIRMVNIIPLLSHLTVVEGTLALRTAVLFKRVSAESLKTQV